MNYAVVSISTQMVMCANVFISLGYRTRGRSFGKSIKTFEEMTNSLPKSLSHFTILAAMYKDSGFPASSSMPVVVCSF